MPKNNENIVQVRVNCPSCGVLEGALLDVVSVEHEHVSSGCDTCGFGAQYQLNLRCVKCGEHVFRKTIEG